jgi:uncharacterized protein YukE
VLAPCYACQITALPAVGWIAKRALSVAGAACLSIFISPKKLYMEKLKMPKKNLKRNEVLFVRVTSDEKVKIRNRMQQAKVKNITNYMRRMALEGEIKTYDFSSVKEGLLPVGEYSVALNRIGNNINQISKKVNETDIVDHEDMHYLSSQVHDMKQNYEAVIKKLTQEITRLRTK